MQQTDRNADHSDAPRRNEDQWREQSHRPDHLEENEAPAWIGDPAKSDDRRLERDQEQPARRQQNGE